MRGFGTRTNDKGRLSEPDTGATGEVVDTGEPVTFRDAVRDRSARRVTAEAHAPTMPEVEEARLGTASPRTWTGPVAIERMDLRRHAGAMLAPASMIGMLAAFGSMVLLGGVLAAAVDGFLYQSLLGNGASVSDIFTVGLFAGLATLFVSMFVGGWAAGRMARFDGVVSGLLVVAWSLGVMALFAAAGDLFGDAYNVFSTSVVSGLPSLEIADVSTPGLLSAVIAVVFMCVGATLGGLLGELSSDHAAADERVLVEQGVVERAL